MKGAEYLFAFTLLAVIGLATPGVPTPTPESASTVLPADLHDFPRFPPIHDFEYAVNRLGDISPTPIPEPEPVPFDPPPPRTEPMPAVPTQIPQAPQPVLMQQNCPNGVCPVQYQYTPRVQRRGLLRRIFRRG